MGLIFSDGDVWSVDVICVLSRICLISKAGKSA